jgi:hypothetical protein
MSETAVALDQRMISFILPSIPESVRIARFHVRAALVTNTICHVADNPAETIAVTIARVWHPAAVTVTVRDSSPYGPVIRETAGSSERGRGLQVVAALSADWGWHPEPGGKSVYAVIARED